MKLKHIINRSTHQTTVLWSNILKVQRESKRYLRGQLAIDRYASDETEFLNPDSRNIYLTVQLSIRLLTNILTFSQTTFFRNKESTCDKHYCVTSMVLYFMLKMYTQ